MSLSNLFEPNDFNIHVKTIDASGALEIGKDDSTTELHLGNTSTPVYVNEILFNPSGTTLTLGAIGSVPNNNGMTLTGTVLNAQPADSTYGGVVSTTTQSFTGQKTFNTGIALVNLASGYIGHVFDYYEQATVVNTSTDGPWTGLAWTLTFTRIGKIVTMQFAPINSLVIVAGESITTGAVIPARFLPSQLCSFSIEIINGVNNSAYGSGVMQINSGIISINNSSRTNFSSTFAGCSGGFVSYLTA